MFPSLHGIVSQELPTHLADLIMALPGFQALWKFDETTGTVAAEAGGTTALNATYGGGIPLAQISLPAAVGGSAPSIQDSGDEITFPFAAMQGIWDWSKGWLLTLYKPTLNALFTIADNANPSGKTLRLASHFNNLNGYTQITGFGEGGANGFWQRHNDWTLTGMKWDTTDGAFGKVTGFLQGANYITWVHTGASGSLANNFFYGRAAGYRGALAYLMIGAGDVPTDAQIDSLYAAIYPTTGKSVLVVGDSWATNNDYWIDQLVADLRTADGNAWREAPYRIGYSGHPVSSIDTGLATDLPAALISQPDLIVLVCAANDINAPTAEAPFKTSFGGILDTIITNCPGVPIVANFPYRDDGYDGALDANALLIKSYMQDVIATKSGSTIYAIDGNVWFKTSIDTWSSDRIHPTTEAGFAELVSEVMTAAGYI